MIRLAAEVFGLPAMTVLGEDYPYHLGPQDAAPTRYLWYTGDHFQVVDVPDGQPILRAEELRPPTQPVTVDARLRAGILAVGGRPRGAAGPGPPQPAPRRGGVPSPPAPPARPPPSRA